MLLEIDFYWKIYKKSYLEKQITEYLRLDPNLFLGQYHCKANGPNISEHTDIQPLHQQTW